MVRAKFTVTSITSFNWSPTVKKITLAPQYDQNIPEDQRFAKMTPGGEFWMNVDNPPASDQLVLGKAFYIDLSPVES
jgi:hypothetical protein